MFAAARQPGAGDALADLDEILDRGDSDTMSALEILCDAISGD